MEVLIFVYGTLKTNYPAHFLMEEAGAKFLGERTTHPRYHLYDQGNFPGIVIGDETGGVVGELFSIPITSQKLLDDYECVDQGLFRPEMIDLADGTQALAYIYSRSPQGAVKIKEGIWHGRIASGE